MRTSQKELQIILRRLLELCLFISFYTIPKFCRLRKQRMCKKNSGKIEREREREGGSGREREGDGENRFSIQKITWHKNSSEIPFSYWNTILIRFKF